MDSNLTEISFEKYIYVMDYEIGTIDANGIIKELKITNTESLQHSAAFELNEQIYLPIHDHRGNVVSLVSCFDNDIETYRYSAYGQKQQPLSSINPWRFSEMRVDVETGWSYFGRRYYDPEVGKWTGPDPIWFEDATNLYAYVHNSPLNYMDPNGLFAASLYHSTVDSFSSVWNSPRFQGACQMFAGAAEMGAGGAVAYGSGCLAAPVGFAIATHGADHFTAGLRTLIYGEYSSTLTSQLIQKTGVSAQTAHTIDNTLSIIGTLGSTPYIRTSQALPSLSEISQGCRTSITYTRESSNLNSASSTALDLDLLAKSGQTMGKQEYTCAGRALQKHSSRSNSVFPKPFGKPSQVNQQAQNILDNILSHPKSISTQYHHPRFGHIIDIKIPNYQGVRYYDNGKFIGFLEP